MDVTFIAVAAATHPLVRADLPITTRDLVSHVQCVVRDSGTHHPRQDGWLGATTRCTVSNVDASLALVNAGLAYAWLPEHLVEEPLRQGTLRALPLVAGRTRNFPLSLVLVRPDCAGPAAQAALECFRRHAPIRRIDAGRDLDE
jgi:DNA-binding transcriptional LysR family regulator